MQSTALVWDTLWSQSPKLNPLSSWSVFWTNYASELKVKENFFINCHSDEGFVNVLTDIKELADEWKLREVFPKKNNLQQG